MVCGSLLQVQLTIISIRSTLVEYVSVVFSPVDQQSQVQLLCQQLVEHGRGSWIHPALDRREAIVQKYVSKLIASQCTIIFITHVVLIPSVLILRPQISV